MVLDSRSPPGLPGLGSGLDGHWKAEASATAPPAVRDDSVLVLQSAVLFSTSDQYLPIDNSLNLFQYRIA